jgi:chromate reductase, NAD(P)H dehydrogenase (quinone)
MNCGVEIVTPQCSVARAGEAFDEHGRFKDERTRKAMENVCRTLIDRARLLSPRMR